MQRAEDLPARVGTGHDRCDRRSVHSSERAFRDVQRRFYSAEQAPVGECRLINDAVANGRAAVNRVEDPLVAAGNRALAMVTRAPDGAEVGIISKRFTSLSFALPPPV